MVREKKRARTFIDDKLGLWYDFAGMYEIDPESDIPRQLYVALDAEDEASDGEFKEFPTWLAAEHAFHAAFIQARAAGWNPDEVTMPVKMTEVRG